MDEVYGLEMLSRLMIAGTGKRIVYLIVKSPCLALLWPAITKYTTTGDDPSFVYVSVAYSPLPVPPSTQLIWWFVISG